MKRTTQTEAVVETIRQLGGVASIMQINQNIFKMTDAVWNTKTPFASIRCILQRATSQIYKIKPGLYGLVEMQKQLEEDGFIVQTEKNKDSKVVRELTHAYFQGLLLEIGKYKQMDTFVPNQDKNRKFNGVTTLGDMRTLTALPQFGPLPMVKQAETIDVIWINEHDMPSVFFEVEHSTDIQNSLSKYVELCDYNTRMLIVADEKRHDEYERKLNKQIFKRLREPRPRVEFLDYKSLEKQYDMMLNMQDCQVKIL